MNVLSNNANYMTYNVSNLFLSLDYINYRRYAQEHLTQLEEILYMEHQVPGNIL